MGDHTDNTEHIYNRNGEGISTVRMLPVTCKPLCLEEYPYKIFLVVHTRLELFYGSKVICANRKSRGDLEDNLNRSPLCKADHVAIFYWFVESVSFPD